MTLSARHIAITAALFASQCAYANVVHIETSGLTFDTSWSPQAETLVSDVNGAATFSLVNAVSSLRFPFQFNYFNDYAGVFQLSARNGYKVTGYTLSGGLFGTVYVGRSPDGFGRPGGADTSAGVMSRAQDAVTGETLVQHGWWGANLQGNADFSFHSGVLNRTGAFNISFDGYAYGQASPAIWTTYEPEIGAVNHYDFSRAEVGLKDPLLLTVYTEALAVAVPEPHTFALTLTGLALLAGVVRRRRRPARAQA
ncbi:PEP-CTERM sorting domain-containing protein [Massilia sp. CCM 8734]|uniref:PEP-CTERM sorting domain-containing protein n=1 Tax=Massilia sp. CCM 8734 TaxID=2609283 RepID=UPI0014221CFD|nr:PEP-CTERM sorting domain-containing protein [Massilia sp. CCM 8734]